MGSREMGGGLAGFAAEHGQTRTDTAAKKRFSCPVIEPGRAARPSVSVRGGPCSGLAENQTDRTDRSERPAGDLSVGRVARSGDHATAEKNGDCTKRGTFPRAETGLSPVFGPRSRGREKAPANHEQDAHATSRAAPESGPGTEGGVSSPPLVGSRSNSQRSAGVSPAFRIPATLAGEMPALQRARNRVLSFPGSTLPSKTGDSPKRGTFPRAETGLSPFFGPRSRGREKAGDSPVSLEDSLAWYSPRFFGGLARLVQSPIFRGSLTGKDSDYGNR